GYGVGSRISLPYTRAIIDAIHNGELEDVACQEDETFGFEVPRECPGVPAELLVPRNTWEDKEAYAAGAAKLAELFQENFKTYADGASEEILSAGPRG
nr:phosphoenolpyruvate carboxykinase (ATP) [Planctomycetota bacterium]